MMSIEQIRRELKNHNYADVSRAAGITRSYVHAIASGAKKNPSYSVLKALSDYLEGGNDNAS